MNLPANSRPTLDALTGARFWAAAAVLAGHYQYAAAARLPEWLAHVPVVSAALSFFFTLSGFVLTYNYYEKFQHRLNRENILAFAKARFARVYPMHIFVLILATPFVLYLLARHSDVVVFEPRTLFNCARSWLANIFLIQAYFPNRTIQNLWNAPAWSVSTEVFFYAICPFFIFGFLRRLKTKKALLGFGVLLFLLELAVFVAARHFPAHWYKDNYVRSLIFDRNPLVRVWEFFIGCCSGAFFLRYRPSLSESSSNRNILLAACLILGTAITLFGVSKSPMAAWANYHVSWTPLLVPILFILAAGRNFLSPFLETDLMILLGEASYSLYLLHWTPLVLLIHHVGWGLVPLWLAMLTMLACVAGSIITFVFIERPSRNFLRGARPAFVQQNS